MGTTASAAPPTTPESFHGNGMMDGRQSLGNASLKTVSIHNSKAKSIITNKVAPVVITYNCRQEFQIHDELPRTHYKVGRISDTMPEHFLVQGSYFMVLDVFSKADVLNTTGSCGAPNFRQSKGSYPLFGMGQPSLTGFQQVLQKLQSQGHEVIFFCVREEPLLFLHLEENFVPYTPRRKENLHENLHGLSKDVPVETLELNIRKELHDFARLNENVFYVYNDIEHFKDEPQKISISCEEDIHVTEEVYKRPLFTMPAYRYYRLPLPMEGAPMEEQFDAFVNMLRENPSLSLNRDESRPLPALLFSCQVGVGRTNLGMILGTLVMERLTGAPPPPQSPPPPSPTDTHSTKLYFLQRALQSLERYIYLILFNTYLHQQYPLAFACNFSQWLCSNAWVYRLLSCMNQSELRAPADLVTKGARVADEYLAPDVLSTVKEMKVANFRRVPKMPVYGMAQPTSEATGVVLSYLTDEKRKHQHVLWVNVQEELVLEANGQIFCPREPSLVADFEKVVDLPFKVSPLTMFKSCQTVQEIFNQHKSSNPGLEYKRIPLPECAAPTEQDFDGLLEAMKSVLAEDSRAAFVFNCSNGRGRSTTAMTIAALTLWHFNGFPEFGEEEIVSVPDAKYTKGEFEVVMKLVRILPDGHRMKREVDMALDSVSETMTPMHYHLREIIICTYRQMKNSKSEQESRSLLLRSLQYLERYMYLILFNTYLHLEKKDSWQRSFSTWMQQVAARAGVYDLLNQLGFSEFENLKDSTLARLRFRWQEQNLQNLPFRGELI
uniref:Paladin n=1 Tax=Pygocentrus nattereri TaxID=42514 RepID=A0AAR2LXN9_PYGNA